MKTLALAAGLSLLTLMPHQAAAQTDETLRLAQEHAELESVQAMLDAMFSPDAMIGLMTANLPVSIQVSNEQLDKIGQIMSEELDSIRPELVAAMITGMAQEFSADEIRALNTFYASEHGASVMIKIQPFFQKVMGDMGPTMARMQGNVQSRVIEVLQE